MGSNVAEGYHRRDKDKPLISLILVTANRADWLGSLLDAIQAQNEGSWELVAVDCGSEDNTLDVLETRAADDSRIKVLSIEDTDKAVGRRQALQKARGQYLAFPDPNSLWSPDFLGHLLKTFNQVPESTGIVYAPAAVLGDGGEVLKTVPGELRHGAMVRELFETPQLPLSALLIRSKVIKPLQKTGMHFWLSNDHALLIWLAHKAPMVACGGKPLVRIRPIEGRLPTYLDAVNEDRGRALSHALEALPRVVPSRFARQCLARFYSKRSVSLAAAGEKGDAFSCALWALMYRPLWPRAWQQLVRLVLR